MAHIIIKDAGNNKTSIDIEGNKFDIANLLAQTYCSDEEFREVADIAFVVIHKYSMELMDASSAKEMGDED
jgi:hypothetical protein